MNHEYWMGLAYQQALKAQNKQEVPVGAIIVKDDNVVSAAHNASISKKDPTAHAEILAIREAAKVIGNYRLIHCDLYVTLEPCMMCAGAIIHARLSKVIFGAYDPKTGAAGTVFDLLKNNKNNHQPEVVSGILGNKCGQLLSHFFQAKRKLQS